MDHFDRIAEDYDHVLPRHVEEHYFLKRMKLFTEVGLEKGLVLDLCSGTGRISAGLIERGFDVVSADLSVNMLLQRKGVEGYKPVNALSYQLPFRDCTFDLVFSVASFHHIADRGNIEKTIHEMQRVTKEGGMIVIWDHNPLNPYWKIIMKKVPQDTGEERLIGMSELVRPFAGGKYRVQKRRMGFVPDFVPKGLMKASVVLESLFEHIPIISLFAAHNVVVARKLSSA